MTRHISFEEWEAERLTDPEFQVAAERLEPAYQVTRLRIARGLTQKELAKKVGTRQSSIARLESGRQEPSVSFLKRVVEALRARLIIQIIPEEDLVIETEPSASDLKVIQFSFPEGENIEALFYKDLGDLSSTGSFYEKVRA